jgi:hypothetical protein
VEERRILRPRNEKVKPLKYSAISKMEEENEDSNHLNEEEENVLKERSGKSNKKYEKKKRRLMRFKERNEVLNTNPVVKIEKEEDGWTIDPFSKYGPSFDGFGN